MEESSEGESVGASSVNDTEEESGGSSSENETERAGNKRLKLEEEDEEDRISDLPDALIHHILSYLPSTEESIRTAILSKRWQNQWTRVPVLIFQSPSVFSAKYDEDLARFIDNTLLQYECSKIKKFHIAYDFEMDINFTSKIRYATKKHVEELILSFYRYGDPDGQYMLPKFIFDNVSLVELKMLNCVLQLSCTINWPSLKVLKMTYCAFGDRLFIGNVLSGSPSLESLEINTMSWESATIASKSLKILILKDIEITEDIEISCPILEELSIINLVREDLFIETVLSESPLLHSLEIRDCILPELDIDSESLKKLVLSGSSQDCAIEISCPILEELSITNLVMEDIFIETVLSESPLLHSLELRDCFVPELDIESESLKKLVLSGFSQDCDIEVSCPNIEELNLHSLNIEKCGLMHLPSSSCATLDVMTPYPLEGCAKDLVKKILMELQAVKELKLGNWFVEILSALEIGGLSYPLLNVKCLTLDSPNFEHILGIVNTLRCSPVLERLVIDQYQESADLDLNNFEETYLGSNGIAFTCLLSHLKTIKIIGLRERDGQCKVLSYVEFLLKNARMLEKMVVKLKGGTDFLAKVSRKLKSFPRCSEHAILELL